MKRRRFLTIAGVGTLIAALATGKFLATSFEDSAEKIIRSELGSLRLDEAGLKAFVRDYALVNDRNYKLIVKSYGLLGIGSEQSGKIHQMVSTYLLSTDFFANKMDESRVVKYIAMYDPYLRPCSHPFASPRDAREIT
jgi:hypothetical protein